MSTPILALNKVQKVYKQGVLRPQTTFKLEADMSFDRPQIVGLMGANGAGKTTLFELITGSNVLTSGNVLCVGQDIHKVKYNERDRLAIHYHQSYQVRQIKRRKPGFLLERSSTDYPQVHLFDEPQFNPQDGYIGFMLNFFRKLRDEGRLVFVCLHPTERYHMEIFRDLCDSFIFVHSGRLQTAQDFNSLMANQHVSEYLSASG